MHISRTKRFGIAAVTMAAVPIIAASAQPTNAVTSRADTFRLVERPGTFRYVDLPPRQTSQQSPASVGDEFIFTSRLFRSGQRVGTVHAVCTITKRSQNPERLPSSCVGTFDLRRGTIELAIGGVLTDTLEIAITGGTGDYAGASGTVTSRSVGRRTIDIVHLEP